MPKSNHKKHYDWVILPQEYFALSLIGCDFLKKLLPNEPFKSKLKDKFNFSHPVSYLIIPIVYNLKHGVELYLKGIGNIWDQDYKHSHDLIFLLNFLIKKLSQNTKFKDVAGILDLELRPLVEKYYFGLYIPINKHKRLPDIQNEAERYPESKSYPIPTIWHKFLDKKTFVVNTKLIEGLEEDIRKIHDILRHKVYFKVCEQNN